jgi:hypothetical protein
MEDEKILKEFEKLGKVRLLDLRKYFSNEEIDRISKLIDSKILKTEYSGIDVFITYEKNREEFKTTENQQNQTQIGENICEMRKEVILEEITRRFNPTVKTISDIFRSILDSEILKGEEKQKFLDSLWFSLPINDVEIIIIADRLQYKIKIEDNEIIFDENEIFTPEAFVKKFFKAFGFVLPKPSRKTYGLWITYIRARGIENIKLKTLETEEELIRNTVVNYIENSYLSKNIEDVFMPNTIYVDGSYVAAPNSIIRRIVELKLEKRIKHKQIANTIRDLLEFSKPTKIKGEIVRMWYFKKDKFNFQRPILEGEGENGENNSGGEARNGENNLVAEQSSGNK